jgi:hypothetical protein
MVTRTLVRVTSAEAAAHASSIEQSTNNDGGKKHALPLPSAGDPISKGNNNENRGGNNKRPLPSEDSISGRESTKRKRTDGFVLDLSDVPPQQPIPKSKGRMKEGASKYTGVTFNKAMNKWQSTIKIDGKQRHIGRYENEEEAAVDYARAVFKYSYKDQEALNKARERNSSGSGVVIDLKDVPHQLPIPRSKIRIKEGSSKYTGVSFHKQMNKWLARINIDGKQHLIGLYENDEEAAVDYARAVFKYKGQGALDKERERNSSLSASAIDLSDVPPQLPVPKSADQVKEGSSKYAGVKFRKQTNKWQAQITIDGKQQCIAHYENEEEAAIDYARAVFKYQGQDALDKARGRNGSGSAINIDLSDVPPQLPIPKRGIIKEGASKYKGVYFNKNKWMSKILIEGKQRYIGNYENEEEAATDYARAVFKYNGEEALVKLREENSSRSGSEISIDVTDVPQQPPIPRSKRHIKEGSSKYAGVSFHKPANKWMVQITIDGKNRHIGLYGDEEEAAINYALAVFKYKGQDALDKAMEQSSDDIDLSDVPPQQPIHKTEGRIKGLSSKYAGVSFNKAMNKWYASIKIEGKQRYIGLYENEEEAAIDYARAVVKYKGQAALDKARERKSAGISIDLSDVPSQQPILKHKGWIKEGASKYTGVYLDRKAKKWQARIVIDGKQLQIGMYENEEEAATDYARAVFKYKGQEALDNMRERNTSGPSIDLSDVPRQLPIYKSAQHIKEGASKYSGVSFHKPRNKWRAQIVIDAKVHYIGLYEKEEEAAADYARAVFKYKRQGELDKAKERRSLSNVRPHQPPQCPKHLLL